MSAFWIAARASHDADLPCKQGETGLARSSTTFRRGTSGNPNGRPRVVFEIRDAARQYGPRCIEILATMAGLTDEPAASAEPVRLGALRELLDRGFGKAVQAVSTQDGTTAIELHLLAARVVSEELGVPAAALAEPQPPTLDLLSLPPPSE